MTHFPDTLLHQLAHQITAVSKPHPTRVAIDGIDAAGKTNAILLFDGIFLLRPELIAYIVLVAKKFFILDE